MAAGMEKAPVTELHVRMDCNGCVQRIKKAMHSIDGVYDVYVDLPQQKLTVVGRADPETLVKAIKKTRKAATICSYIEPGVASDQPPPTEPEAASNHPAADAVDQPPSEAPPPMDPPKDAPPHENPASMEAKPAPEAKDVEEVHMVHHYPHDHTMREHWNDYPPMGHQIQHEAPYYVTHSYNTYRPSPNVSRYGYLQSPPQDTRYHTVEAYGDGYYQNQGGDGNQITSMFSDENPNACRIV